MDCQSRPLCLGLRKCCTSWRPNACLTRRRARVMRQRTFLTRCTLDDPWKTLGIAEDADEQQIKKAYRKLALKHHPDLRGSEGASRFVKIQEAYEIVTGKRRGATVDDKAHTTRREGSWDFHDWYWKFTASKRWDQQRKKEPASARAGAGAARPSGAPEEALRSQLAGLKRKAAFRRRSRQHSPAPAAHAPGYSATEEAASESFSSTQPAHGQQEAGGAQVVNEEVAWSDAQQCSSHQQPAQEEWASDGVNSSRSSVSQLAGLKRRAEMRKAGTHTVTTAASSVNDHVSGSTAGNGSTPQASNAESAEEVGSCDELAVDSEQPEFGAKDRRKHVPIAGASPYVVAEAKQGRGSRGASAGEAARHRQASAQIDPMKCAREFMAEVQRRSSTSNIVAATWTGLRVHLALTAASAAECDGVDSSAEEERTRTAAHNILWESADHAVGTGAGAPPHQPADGVPSPESSGDSGTSDAGRTSNGPEQNEKDVGSAGPESHGSQQGSAPSLNRELSSQLAGLRRRAKIRQYTA